MGKIDLSKYREQLASLEVGERHTKTLSILLDLKKELYDNGYSLKEFLELAESLYEYVPQHDSKFPKKEYNGIVTWILRLDNPKSFIEKRRIALREDSEYKLQISPVKIMAYSIISYNENFIRLLFDRFGDIDGYFDGYNTTYVYDGGGIKKVGYDERTLRKQHVAVEISHDGMLFGKPLYPGSIRILFEGEKAAYLMQAAFYSIGRCDIETYAAGGKEAMRKFVYGTKRVNNLWWLSPDTDAYEGFSTWERLLPDPATYGVSDFGDFKSVLEFTKVAKELEKHIFAYEEGKMAKDREVSL